MKAAFLQMQESFSGRLEDAPEPSARADHGRWTSYAECYFLETDHLVRVTNISVGQIKKLRAAGVATMTDRASGWRVPKLANDTLEKLAAQARLQLATERLRIEQPDVPPVYEVLPPTGEARRKGLAALPAPRPADVFFDIEGYPLHPGGLEYLLGASTCDTASGVYEFHDWWAHDREQERVSFEAFVDWVHGR